MLAGASAAWHLGYLDRQPDGRIPIWLPPVKRLPDGLAPYVSVVRILWNAADTALLAPRPALLARRRLDIVTWATGLPAFGPEALLVQIATRPPLSGRGPILSPTSTNSSPTAATSASSVCCPAGRHRPGSAQATCCTQPANRHEARRSWPSAKHERCRWPDSPPAQPRPRRKRLGAGVPARRRGRRTAAARPRQGVSVAGLTRAHHASRSWPSRSIRRRFARRRPGPPAVSAVPGCGVRR